MGHAARRATDRLAASDPGLLRLANGLTTTCAILLTLLVLAVAHTPVQLLVTGGLTAMVASFAISDRGLADQAVTLALGLPVALAVIVLGAELYDHRVASDVAFVALIFAAVYVRRFGPRGTGLGIIGFQLYFVSQFTRAGPSVLPRACAVVAVAFGAAAAVRFGLVRATPERVLHRLRRAFRARLAGTVDAQAALAGAPPGSPAADAARDALRRRTGLLHQCALMIQARLETSTADPRTASLVERRIVEAEIAAERVGALLIRVHASGPPAPAVTRLTDDLRALRRLTARADRTPVDAGLAAARDRLLGYLDGAGLPDGPADVRRLHRAIGETARAVFGLRITAADEADTAGTAAEGAATARSREELETEDLGLLTDAVEPYRPPARAGLNRTTTRLAFQVAAGSALAIIGGELLSPQRWYWAVLTCWVVFMNTSTRGDVLVKGYRRFAGTVVGVVAGGVLAGAVGHDPWLAFALVIVCVFGMFYTAPLSYALMSFFVTTMIGLLCTLLRVFSAGVLLLRVEETALGAACGFAAAVLVLPVRLDRLTDERLIEVLERLRATLALTLARLAGGPPADLVHSARELDLALDALRASAEPIVHPASPLRDRRRRVRHVMGLLDDCAYHVRSLASLAETCAGGACGVPPARLAGIARRLDHNVSALADAVASGRGHSGRLEPEPADPPPEPRMPEAVRAERHLRRVDEAVLALAAPLGLRDRDGAAKSEGATVKVHT